MLTQRKSKKPVKTCLSKNASKCNSKLMNSKINSNTKNQVMIRCLNKTENLRIKFKI